VSDNSTKAGDGVEATKRFLVGNLDQTRGILQCCPTASTMLATELETGLDSIIAIPCRRWGCRWCGQRKAFQLACKCEQAKPERFITLTIDPKHWLSPREAYDGTRRKLSDFAKEVRKLRGEFEYLRVLEVTKKGWPHYHFLAKCPYIPQTTLSKIWASLTGAVIVDVRRVEHQRNVFRYVLKYLCKQTYVPWTSRRVSWSRNFFPKPEAKEPRQNPFINRRRVIQHPSEWASKKYFKRTITERRPGVWVVDELVPDCTLDSPSTNGE
jgi:hypothetical protein